MIKNILFDLYGTLIDIHTDESTLDFWEKVSLYYKYNGANYSPSEMEFSYRTKVTAKHQLLKDQYQHTEIKLLDVFEELYLDKGVAITQEGVLYTAQIFRLLSTEYIRLYPEVKELLTTLKSRGYRLFILSNAQRCLTMPEIIGLGLVDYFEGIYISSDFNCGKPEQKFYNELLVLEGLLVEESIMIGNDRTCDILGAKQVGLKSIYLASNLSPEADLSSPITADYEMPIDKITNILTILQ